MSATVEISLAVMATVVLVRGIAEMVARIKTFHKRKESVLALMVRHFQPLKFSDLVSVSRTFPTRVRADLQKSVDAAFGGAFKVDTLTGLRAKYSFVTLDFKSLGSEDDAENILLSPIQYEEVDIGEDEPVRTMVSALWLLSRDGQKYAFTLNPVEKYGEAGYVRVEMAYPKESEQARVCADELLKKLEEGVASSRSYKGKVLSLESNTDYSGRALGIAVHRLRKVARDEIILPESTLDLLDRNLLRFVEQRERLAAMGLSIKKGLLFYGPPGTGKTHTLHYLTQALEGHTFFLLNGEQQGLLTEYMTLARMLQPSVVVLEDADLIARNREDAAGPCPEGLLNRLLNEMDGLREDAKIIFVLTTNRPETLEPALTSRPGRIDQAVEFPLPDARNRERLIRLYAGRLAVDDALVAAIVKRTDAVSAAFIKELVRRAAQFAFEHGREDRFDAGDLENALQEMLQRGGALNERLLGGRVGFKPREE